MPGRTKELPKKLPKELPGLGGSVIKGSLRSVRFWVQIASTHVKPGAMGYTCNHRYIYLCLTVEAKTGDPRTSPAVNLAIWVSFRFGERL